MNWEIIITIVGNETPTSKQITKAKLAAEEAVIEALDGRIQFIDTKAFKA